VVATGEVAMGAMTLVILEAHLLPTVEGMTVTSLVGEAGMMIDGTRVL